MKTRILAALTLILMSGAAATAQPRDDHHRPSPPPMAHPGNPPHPAMMMGRNMGPQHHLPPGFAAPRGHDRAPMWHGRSWAVGDPFFFGGFNGPTITDVGGYGLPPHRPGTHWIYVDGWFLMVGNRTGKIFSEVPANY